MKPPLLHFHGAAGSVTGSCFRLVFAGQQILVDCGMFQGAKSEKELNYRPFPFDAHDIAAVVLTHAHIDHSGLLPKLVRAGFAGKVHATRATADLCAVMLPDSGHIQEIEVQQLNRRNAQRGRRTVQPIYTAEDAVGSLKRLHAEDYDAWFPVVEGIRGRFWNAGHLLGSASLELELARAGAGGGPLRLLFSGDIGPAHKLLQPEAGAPSGIDYLVCESTYGNRDRPDSTPAQRRHLLEVEVAAAQQAGATLLIPSFAVERTQELLVDLYRLMRDGALPWAPITIDSPLATRASAVFDRHAEDIREGELLREALASSHVHFTETIEQSKALNNARGFQVVIAASGMCEAGRIRHHLKNWLWRDGATVLLVGYQAQGTLGRILQDGAPRVRIQGEEIEVRARIRSLDLYSGHADGPELAEWMAKRKPVRCGVFLVHGEDEAMAGLRARAAAVVPDDQIITPTLDRAYTLGADAAIAAETAQLPRLKPDRLGHTDWHNDASRLLLDINNALDKAADGRSRAAVLRRLRRALESDEPGAG